MVICGNVIHRRTCLEVSFVLVGLDEWNEVVVGRPVLQVKD